MANTIKELRELSDDEIIKRHDNWAEGTFPPKVYFNELKRRNENRRNKWLLGFTAAIAAATVVNVAFSVCDMLR